jgi:predicted  nucleic acid-binding Zn-ribbon protein
MKRTQGRIYGGMVVDPRELSSLQKEYDHAVAQRDALEERYLETMEHLERTQTQLGEARERVSTLEEGWETAKPGLAQQVQDAAAAIQSLRSQRESLVAALDPRTLDLYTRLRTALGHAVSQVSGGVCGWCRVTIPPKDIQHARGNAIVTCPNCRRILYI